MKQTEFKEWQYTLTHAMQHEKGSVIHLKVNSNTHTGIIRTQLLLTIDGPEDYHVSRHNSSSGPGEAHASYQVFPALPMDIENLHFTLVPYAPPIEEPPKTIILNKTIEFLKSGGN